MSLSIKDLLEDKAYGLDLQLLCGEAGLLNRLYSSRIQKPGLALTGYTEHLHPDRVQVLGNTEISYLSQVPEEDGSRHIEKLLVLMMTGARAPSSMLWASTMLFCTWRSRASLAGLWALMRSLKRRS